MNKNSKKATASKVSAKLAGFIASAGSIGFGVSGAFEDAVVLVRDAVKSLPKGANPLKHQGMIDLGLQYKGGYIARRLQTVAAYAERWDNMDQALRISAALDIYARPGCDTGKPDRRTVEEHKACRAADTSFTKIRERAGIVSERSGLGGRKPRPAANKAKAPPVDLVKASPKLATKVAANDYFTTACAALLATVNKNAVNVDPRISTAVSDFHAAMKKAGFIQ